MSPVLSNALFTAAFLKLWNAMFLSSQPNPFKALLIMSVLFFEEKLNKGLLSADHSGILSFISWYKLLLILLLNLFLLLSIFLTNTSFSNSSKFLFFSLAK